MHSSLIFKNTSVSELNYLLNSWPDKEKDYKIVVQIVMLQLMGQIWQAFGDNLRFQATRSREEYLASTTQASRIKGEEIQVSYRRVESISKLNESLPSSDSLKACALTQQSI